MARCDLPALLLALCACGARPSPAIGAAARADVIGDPERPEVWARRVTGPPIVIDGVRERAWDSVTPAVFATDWSGAETSARTGVRFLWSADALYVLWELEGAGLHADASRSTKTERTGLYEEDCVEL